MTGSEFTSTYKVHGQENAENPVYSESMDGSHTHLSEQEESVGKRQPVRFHVCKARGMDNDSWWLGAEHW